MKRICLAVLFVSIVALFSHAIEPLERDFIFEYGFILKNIPPDTSKIEIWVPYPSEMPYQEIENITAETKYTPQLTYDKKYRNKMLYFEIKNPEEPDLELSLRYRVRRYEYANKPVGGVVIAKPFLEESELNKYLTPSKLVTISPRVVRIASEITRDKKNDLEKARAIYDYVFVNVEYNKTVPGWGQGDTERVCDVRKGNCTDFHSLFISLARASGIPARFVIGMPISKAKGGTVKGYHCWAEFYIRGLGWIPVDISEAWKDETKYEYHFGALDENRIEFTHGRDIILEPAQNNGPLNYFIYPYVEVDGKVFGNVEKKWSFQANDTKGGE